MNSTTIASDGRPLAAGGTALASNITDAVIAPADDRRRLADRVFYIAVAVNCVLTLFCILAMFSGVGARFAGNFRFDARSLATVLFAFLFFNVLWAVIWYGVKNLLLKVFVGMSREDRRAVFSSRMAQPFDLNALLGKYSERRIRIADMIGRRGRFITLAAAFCFFLYAQLASGQSQNPATAFTSQSLFEQVISNWVFLACFYVGGFVGATMYGAQTRIMDGTTARANCMAILTLWALFKFVLIPIGAELGTLYPREQFALLFALIWGTYIVVDTFSEVGGSLYGTMKIRVRGVGDVNRKSFAGTLTGVIAGLVFSVGIVALNGLSGAYIALAVTVALASSALELFSPRGTDDFTMATGNALICWAFGAWVFS
ncbi:MAG TPA: hypothetical protein VFP37_19495 [Steroidobacteraceae bacterium]|nr:hypothetical protein [Steroidobacteraceae bacterium]